MLYNIGGEIMKLENQLKLLQLLQEDTYTSSEILAFSLGVSSRTIRNELKIVNKRLENYGATIISKPRYGFKIQVKDFNQFRSYLRTVEEKIKETHKSIDSHNRFLYILDLLLNNDSFIKLEQLCQTLYISRISISHDIKKVRKYLKKYYLEIINKPYYGIKIVGKEEHIRACLINYYHLRFQENHYQLFLNNEFFTNFKPQLEKILTTYHFNYDPVSLSDLSLHLSICIQRIKTNHNIIYKSTYDTKYEYEIITEIFSYIEHYENIYIHEDEKVYYAMVLKSRRNLQLLDISQQVYRETEISVKKLLKEIYHYYRIDFLEGHDYDQELIQSLILHLIPFKLRIQNNIPLQNPMIQNIKMNYTLSFFIANIASQYLGNYFQKTISEDEVGYLTYYFELALRKRIAYSNKKNILLITDMGRGSESLLTFQFQQTFPHHILSIQTINSQQLSTESLQTIDHIFSTVPMPNTTHKKITYVPYSLTNLHIIEINKILRQPKKSFATPTLHQDLFFTHIDLKTKDDVIQFMCQKISENMDISFDLYQDLSNRESQIDSYFDNLSALTSPTHTLHGETIICVAILNKPIKWNDHRVQFICLVCNETSFNRNLMRFYEILTKILSNKQYMNKIIYHKDFNVVMKYYREIEREFLK
jgi:lichenan operon transcriptional antiterminator